MNNYAAGWIDGWMNGILQTKNLRRRQAVNEETNSYINYLVVYITERERASGSSAFGLCLINEIFIRHSTLQHN